MTDILGQIDAALDEHDKVKSSIEKNTQRFDPLGGSVWDDDRVDRWGDAMRVRLVSSTGIEEAAEPPEAVVEAPGRDPRCTCPPDMPPHSYMAGCAHCEAFVARLDAWITERPGPPRVPFSLPPEDYEALYGGTGAEPTFTVIDETHTFARHYLNEWVEAIRRAERRAHPARLVQIATEDEFACEVGEDGQCDNDCIGPPAPHVDAALEPDMSECRNVPNIPTRPWWSRLLPSRRTR